MLYCATVPKAARVLLLCLVFADSPALAGDPVAAARLRIHRDLERGQTDRALAEVRRSEVLPGSGEDAAFQVLSARTFLEAGEIDLASRALDRAEKLGRPGATAAAFELRRRLRRDFGALEIAPEAGGKVSGTVFVEAVGPLGGLGRQRAFERIRSRAVRQRRAWPAGLVLPWGDYRVNGVPVSHSGSADSARVVVPFPRFAVLRPSGDGRVSDVVAALVGELGGRVEVYDTAQPDPVLQPILADLARRPPRALVAVGPRAAALSRRRLSALPQVYVRLRDAGALDALGRPQASARVLHRPPPHAVLDRLVRLAPSVRSVGILHDPRSSLREAGEAVSVAAERGLRVRTVTVAGAEDVATALAELGASVDAYWLFGDPATATDAALGSLLGVALPARRPVVAPSLAHVQQGASMALEVDPDDEGRLAGALARAFAAPSPRAAKPAPPKTPRVRWILHRRVAAHLGLALPPSTVRDAWRIVDHPLPTLAR